MEEIDITQAPDCVLHTVEKRLNELEHQIRDYEDILRQLEAEYAAHARFLCSFGAGNLSQEGSDNMFESPQADA